jgi:hypothetical protein
MTHACTIWPTGGWWTLIWHAYVVSGKLTQIVQPIFLIETMQKKVTEEGTDMHLSYHHCKYI